MGWNSIGKTMRLAQFDADSGVVSKGLPVLVPRTDPSTSVLPRGTATSQHSGDSPSRVCPQPRPGDSTPVCTSKYSSPVPSGRMRA